MSLRIALLAPLISPIREPQIGGVATFITDLAAGLQQAGHEVALFAASGSAVEGIDIVDTGVDAAHLAGTLFRPFGDWCGSDEARRRAAPAHPGFEAAYAAIASGDYDLVHNHAFDAAAIELAAPLGIPVIHTLHLPPDPLVAEAIHSAAAGSHPPVIAAVSASQRRGWEPHVPVDALLRPGVPTARIPWSARSDGALLYAGRISPEKGVLEAIRIARSSEREIVVAGGPYDEPYAERVGRAAAAGDGVTLAGPLTRTELWHLMTMSAALVFPILWEEPFGMVTAEAQAAGCPVIGFRGGALADVVVDGVTGALVERGDVEAACEAVSAVARFDRRACRRHAERSLDVTPAIRAHVDLYEAVAGGGRRVKERDPARSHARAPSPP